ncbi:Slx4p interacting protein [Xylographa soralifera]|nr:Slx4p interacting protein [Xylographa soralifera]
MSLGDKLSNLHLLLQVPSFARWPLEVHFLSNDVYRRWARCSENATTELQSGTGISLNFQGREIERAPPLNIRASEQSKAGDYCKEGIEALDPSYASYKTHLDKSLFMLVDVELVHCVVCGDGMHTPNIMALVCPNDECRAAFHVTCLASTFLRKESQQNILPVYGNCPSCKLQLQWTRLITELSLRIRGSKEIVRLEKKPRKHKTKKPNDRNASNLSSMVEYDTDNDMNGLDQQDADRELSIADIVDEPLIDEAQYCSLSDMDDTISVSSMVSDTSQFSGLRSPAKSNLPLSRLDTVIEDSDWDAAEVLD